MVPASSKEYLDIQLDIQANYRVYVHSKTRTWYDNNTQLRKHQCFENSPYCWPYSSQGMFVTKFFCVVGYELSTNLKCRVNISILYWGRGYLFKTFPVTKDTFSMGFAFPKKIRFFLIASFTILIGNLSSRAISNINFHMVFRIKLAVVLLRC